MGKSKIAWVAVILVAGVLSGCPEDKMNRYYIRGDVVDASGQALNDVVITVDICADGTIEAKEVTYDSDGFTIIERSWEDCDTVSLTFEQISCEANGVGTSPKTEIIQQDRLTSEDRQYDYYTDGIVIEL